MRTFFAAGSLFLFLLFSSFGQSAKAQDADLQKRIKEAVDNGVAYLKQFKVQDQVYRMGAISLIGWTLLESGCTAKDPSVQSIADEVRRMAIDNGETYSLSLAVIFLDKLGDGGDVPLIDSMTLRLLVAESKTGGWTYNTPVPSAKDQESLRQSVVAAKAKRDNGAALPVVARDPKEMTKEWERQWKDMQIGPLGLGFYDGDNSNTQFAMMALWVARRHGLPVHKGLASVEQRFRKAQHEQGAWGYTNFLAKAPAGVALPPQEQDSYPPMTCAGLLGIALGAGLKDQAKDLAKDPQAKKGLQFLEKYITGLEKGLQGGKSNYFLFSLERMAIVYDLKKIGDVDWYTWGAKHLLEKQNQDGAWPGSYTGYGSDTCFALLFLKRANVAEDLTNILQGIIRKTADEPPRKKGG
ncbi:MAG: hypothetical protein L0215_07560 [Gemmataceae bacterium]|nr:hypothetical protein [Gemmataceae bacterium]